MIHWYIWYIYIYIYIYDFQQFETIWSFGDTIYTGKISINEAEMNKTNLLVDIADFSKKSKPRSRGDNDKKQNTFDSVSALYEEFTYNAFRSGTFPMNEKQGKRLKILAPKQMLQRLPIALAQVKAGKASENLLNEIRQIIYSLYRAKEITKKVYDNIMNPIEV